MINCEDFAALAAEEKPSRPAITGGGELIAYGELARRVASGAAMLQTMGFQAGERIAWIAELSVDSIVFLLSVLKLWAVAIPVSARWPQTLVRKSLPNVGTFTLVDPEDVRRVAHSDLDPVPRQEGPPHAGIIVFTSGSTGRPKAVVHTYAQYIQAARASNAVLPIGPGDRWQLTLPLHHVGGLGILFRCLVGRARIDLLNDQHLLTNALVDHASTHVSLVPTQLYRALQLAPVPLPGLRVALIGGAPLPTALRDQALANGWPIATSYGCTELCSQIATSQPGDALQIMRALPQRELRIGPDGEILVRSPSQAIGYLIDGELQPAKDAGGWYHTGDLGELGKDGALTVSGRIDNQFVCGGENVQPETIERELLAQAGVIQAIVVPVADAEWGKVPVAFVQQAGGKPVAAEALRAALRERLPGLLVPRRFLPWPAEASGGMKVSRARLRELAEEA